MKCPNCGEECTCDTVDVGVGEMQSSPYGCKNCGWVQPNEADLLNEREHPDHTLRIHSGGQMEKNDQDQHEEKLQEQRDAEQDAAKEPTPSTAQGDGDPGAEADEKNGAQDAD